jgi:hypothetical protein
VTTTSPVKGSVWWGVNLERREPIGGPVADDVITVEIDFKPTGLPLFSGEARSVTAALIHAANIAGGIAAS